MGGFEFMNRFLVIVALLLGQGFLLHGVTAGTRVLEGQPVANPVTVEPLKAPGDPVSLVLDDGSVDNSIGIGGNSEFIFLNRFTPAEFPLQLTEIQVYFAGDSTGLVVGDPIDVYVWENTAGNADPAVGATYLGGESSTIAVLDDWTTVMLSTPIQCNGPGGDVLVAVVHRVTGTSTYPADLDTTASQGRSWIGWYTATNVPDPPTLPPDYTWVTIDTLGLAGNWLLRAGGSVVPVELMSFTIR